MSSSNIKAVTFTEAGLAVEGRARLLGVYFTNTATASSLELRDGSVDGSALLNLQTPASAGSQDLLIADMGILFKQGIYIVFGDANVTSVTVLFEGGAVV